jgi:hypothetical protein
MRFLERLVQICGNVADHTGLRENPPVARRAALQMWNADQTDLGNDLVCSTGLVGVPSSNCWRDFRFDGFGAFPKAED